MRIQTFAGSIGCPPGQDGASVAAVYTQTFLPQKGMTWLPDGYMLASMVKLSEDDGALRVSEQAPPTVCILSGGAIVSLNADLTPDEELAILRDYASSRLQ